MSLRGSAQAIRVTEFRHDREAGYQSEESFLLDREADGC